MSVKIDFEWKIIVFMTNMNSELLIKFIAFVLCLIWINESSLCSVMNCEMTASDCNSHFFGIHHAYNIALTIRIKQEVKIHDHILFSFERNSYPHINLLINPSKYIEDTWLDVPQKCQSMSFVITHGKIYVGNAGMLTKTYTCIRKDCYGKI